MEFHAVVLAAGRGSRIPELTAQTPKPLLPIGNKPMIWYSLNMLEKAGFEEVRIIVLKSQLAEIQQLLKLHKVKLQIYYVDIPDDSNWGTAESLRHLSERMKITSDLLIISCDLVTTLPIHMLADMHRTTGASVTMLLAKTPDLVKSSAPGSKTSKKQEKDIIGLDKTNNRLLFVGSEADYEESVTFKKPFLRKHPCMRLQTNLLDGHIYLMKKWILDDLKINKSILSVKGELIPYLVQRQFNEKKEDTTDFDKSSIPDDSKCDLLSHGDDLLLMAKELSSWNDHSDDVIRCYAYIMEDGICLRANNILTYCEANRQVPVHMPQIVGSDMPPLVHSSVVKQGRVQIGLNCMVAEGTTIGNKVNIKQSVVGKNCTIGEFVHISNSIIMDNVTIGDGCIVTGCVIASKNELAPKCELKECLVGRMKRITDSFTNEVLIAADQMMEISS